MPLHPTPRWTDEVPGTRWLRADLHIHTIDDPPRALPAGLEGPREAPAVLEAYARRLLDAAVAQGIEVLGLTPHQAEVAPGRSAVLAVRDLWRDGARATDGARYRDLIYAVYPGYEPNFQDGRLGVHLLFLFDPAVEASAYLASFAAIMRGRAAHAGPNLERTTCRPREAFATLDDPKCIGAANYVVIAAHPTQQNGLLNRPAAEIPELVGDRVIALELRRAHTLREDLDQEKKVLGAHRRGRALLHSSDANDLPELGAAPTERQLGHRFTLLKLSAPTIGALRQALLAREARVRQAFLRAGPPTSALVVDPQLPAACPLDRPWLRQVEVRGGTSFHRGQTFRFSPDLTCVIGGSMTGKSTLLDGLRRLLSPEASLPPARTPLGDAVRARADQRFLSGGAEVLLESPAGDTTRPVSARFSPFQFFGQGELRRLTEDLEGLERLLFHLLPGRAAELTDQRERLRAADEALAAAPALIVRLQETVEVAEGAFQRADRAREALTRFAAAGADTLPPAQQALSRAQAWVSDVQGAAEDARALLARLEQLRAPGASDHDPGTALPAPLRDVAMGMRGVAEQLDAALEAARAEALAAQAALEARTLAVQRALVAAGGSAADLNTFAAHSRAAQNHESYAAALDEARAHVQAERERMRVAAAARAQLTATHRAAMSEVVAGIEPHMGGRLRVEVVPEGDLRALEAWLLGLRKPGLTQWWNNEGKGRATASAVGQIAAHVEAQDLPAAQQACAGIGMSEAVRRTFLEVLSARGRQLEAQALRAGDSYRLLWVEDGEARSLDALSGGRKLAVALSLLLEADDPTPLFIDQPEDELDNRFLNDTIIPALHRLKGRRQVIFATHNANIVVNGDADQVIALEATAQQARVLASGAIEDDTVRGAILSILDGGEAAFALRRAKYGY